MPSRTTVLVVEVLHLVASVYSLKPSPKERQLVIEDLSTTVMSPLVSVINVVSAEQKGPVTVVAKMPYAIAEETEQVVRV